MKTVHSRQGMLCIRREISVLVRLQPPINFLEMKTTLKTEVLVALGLIVTLASPLRALSPEEIKQLKSGWSIDVTQGESKASPKITGSSGKAVAANTTGLKETTLTSAQVINGYVRLSAFAGAQRSVIVQVRWIGKNAANALFLLKEEKISLDVPNGKGVTFSSSSGEVETTSRKMVTGSRIVGTIKLGTPRGEKIHGWAVAVIEQSSQMAVFAKGSSHELDQYALSDAWITYRAIE